MPEPIDTTLIPPQVRADGPQGEQLYAAALQFEQLLTRQLAQSLVPEDDDLGPYAAELPDALAQSVSGAGGLGLALDLYRGMKP
jgi:hypothetical protein